MKVADETAATPATDTTASTTDAPADETTVAVPAEVQQSLLADDVPGSVTTSETSTKRPRRRATRGEAAPEPVTRGTTTAPASSGVVEVAAVDVPVAAVAAVPTETATDPLAAAIASLDERPAPRRRRSARREAGAPAPLPDLTAAIAAVIDGVAGETEETEVEADEVVDAELETGDVMTEEAVAAESDDDSDDDDSDDEVDEVDEVDEFDEVDEVEGSDEESAATRRRRRRRGGRRRRRAGDAAPGEGDTTSDTAGESVGESGDAGDDADDADDDDVNGAGGEGDSAEAEGSDPARRRRRRRRRRGEEATTSDDDPTEVVVRVREPRSRRRTPAAAPSDEVTGIEGSTRMEAKRIRRREGRAAGRRRAPILSEAEFLTRRESVDRQMLIRQKDDYSQIAVLEDGVLVEHYVDRASATSLIGNVYVGKVQNVLPSMEAAFVDIGRGRNAVLYAGEVDWDSFGADGQTRKVEKVFKSGQPVLVQVTKDPVGAKGARLTSHISLPGRYLVYAPGGNLSGISRKLPEQERARLKSVLGDLVPDEASVIIRTAAEGATEEELVRDVNRLKAQWEAIEKKVKQGSAPQQLYGEPDLTVRIVRDLFTEDFTKLVIDGNGSAEDAYDTVNAYVTHVAPHLADRMSRWDRTDGADLFAANRIDEQIAKALERKVFLPSGGSLIIDRTEAMTVIDVNTGRFTGSGGNLEATVTSNNLEAAEEIVRQLRLRDIGGIIVIDFIDMVLPSNRELLLRRLVECLGRDRTRHQVAEVTSLGLVQMTRKKIGTGLAEAFTETCSACGGRGYHRRDEPVESQAHADGGERHHNGNGNSNGRNRRS